MATRTIPFPVSSAPGAKAQEAGGRIINGYVEQLGPQAPSSAVVRRMPGLTTFGTSALTGFRGAFINNGVLYVAKSGKLESYSSAGGAGTLVGNMAGTKRGFFAANNNATPDKWFVDTDTNIFTFTPSAVTAGWPDPDLPAPNSTDMLDGFGLFTIADGRFFATDLNTTSVNALSFGRAQAKPDGLVRVVCWGGRALLFGNQSTEVWTDQGLIPFPLTRSQVIPRGLAGPYCVSGYEDGFSRGPIWVGDDNTVVALNGYTPTKISPPDLDDAIENTTDKTTLEATTFMSHGHAFWQLSSPNFTWLTDLNTGEWYEGNSYLLPRSRRSGAISAFNLWLTGDTKSGNILQITDSAFDELGDPLRLRIESGPVQNFPSGEVVGRADFYFATGVGIATGIDPQQTDPDVEISWSDDGGITWSNPIVRKLGRQQKPQQLISLVACTGRSSWIGRRWRLDISNAVYGSFMYATQSTDARAS
jgi:hypothetical protein